MSRRCERPGCSAPATVAYGFSTDRLLAWLGPMGGADRNAAGALCDRHADAMVPPRGWWLDDRRTDEPTLFRDPAHRPDPPDRRAGHHGDENRRRPARRAHELVIGEQLALDAAVVGPPAQPPGPDGALEDGSDEATPDAPSGERGGDGPATPPDGERPDGEDAPVPPAAATPAEPWTPSFDVTDDLGGLLDARTPLLARAFRGRRSTARPLPSD